MTEIVATLFNVSLALILVGLCLVMVGLIMAGVIFFAQEFIGFCRRLVRKL